MAYHFGVMRDELAEPGRRDEAAKALLPYCHPRLQAIELSGKDGGPIQTEDTTDSTQVARKLLFFLQKVAKEKK